ncbi:hypothetical protein P3W45_000646 [Vairimorpha bombi]
MGNKSSKIKSPYEILEVSPLDSLRDIKLSYLRLMKKNTHSKYNTAYSLIKMSPPPLELYTDNLIKYRDDIVEKINMFGKCSIPLLSSSEYKKSYMMLSRLNIKYQWRNDTDRKYFYYHLDRIINYLRKNDHRFNFEEENDVRRENKKINEEVKKVEKPSPYKCTDCNKSFKSSNTLLDHYKKHVLNARKYLIQECSYYII